LVAAFRATLEEILDADLLLHVVDASHPNVVEQAVAVQDVLDELGAQDMPVITALNKIDRLPEGVTDPDVEDALPDGVPISALTGRGLDDLLERIELQLITLMAPVEVLIPYDSGEMVDLFHRHGLIAREAHQPDGTLISGRLPRSLVGRFQSYSTAHRK
jgi:GTP-binding protein HflX